MSDYSFSDFIPAPNFIVGPKSFKERVFSLCHPLKEKQKKQTLNANRFSFIQACMVGDLDLIHSAWNTVEGLNWKMKMFVQGQFCLISPLSAAIKGKNVDLVEIFLKAGADPAFDIGSTSGAWAVHDYPALEIFNKNINKELMATSADVEILTLMLEHGLDKHINKIWNWPSIDNNKNTLLHLALQTKKADEMAEILLNYGADPTIENKAGQSVILMAADSLRPRLIDAVTQKNLQLNLPKVSEPIKHKSRL